MVIIRPLPAKIVDEYLLSAAGLPSLAFASLGRRAKRSFQS
jgi:hypothetical protein